MFPLLKFRPRRRIPAEGLVSEPDIADALGHACNSFINRELNGCKRYIQKNRMQIEHFLLNDYDMKDMNKLKYFMCVELMQTCDPHQIMSLEEL